MLHSFYILIRRQHAKQNQQGCTAVHIECDILYLGCDNGSDIRIGPLYQGALFINQYQLQFYFIDIFLCPLFSLDPYGVGHDGIWL
ncbi:hypothetical protein D3C76_1522280 [compost metagenome]